MSFRRPCPPVFLEIARMASAFEHDDLGAALRL